MLPRNGWSRLLSLAIVFLLFPIMVRGDVVQLKHGGVVRGEIVKRSRNSTASTGKILLKTPGGSSLIIDRSEIESLQHRRMILEEYELLSRQVPDTVKGQWDLAEWCRNQRLLKERKTHLQRIVELDPLHEEARRGLGHQQYEGKWMSRDEFMLSQGKVPYRGRYVFPQELEQILKDQSAKEEEREWHKKVKLWLGWAISSRPERRAKGVQELSAISDPNAIPALSKRFRDHANVNLRLLYVEILSRIEGEQTLNPLLYQLIFDQKREVRSAAISAVSPDQQNEAISALAQGLKSDLNLVVNRCATALGEFGDDQVVPLLIDALITTHKYRVTVPDNGANSIAMAADGSGTPTGSYLPPGIEAGLLTGQFPNGVIVNRPNLPGEEMRRKTVLVERQEKNGAVLEALRRLSDQDFSYNRNQWRLWWTEKKNTVGKS